MRTVLAAVAAALSLTVPSASAAHQDLINGTIEVDCFGCGPSAGRAAFLVNAGYLATATFTFFSDSGSCPLRGQGYGTISGYYNGGFYFEHINDALYLRIDDPHRASDGVGVFHVSGGNPCGRTNVIADVAAVVAGV